MVDTYLLHETGVVLKYTTASRRLAAAVDIAVSFTSSSASQKICKCGSVWMLRHADDYWIVVSLTFDGFCCCCVLEI